MKFESESSAMLRMLESEIDQRVDDGMEALEISLEREQVDFSLFSFTVDFCVFELGEVHQLRHNSKVFNL